VSPLDRWHITNISVFTPSLCATRTMQMPGSLTDYLHITKESADQFSLGIVFFVIIVGLWGMLNCTGQKIAHDRLSKREA
jgi:hypothetical protein